MASSQLVLAKEALARKQFDECLQLCKALLAQDAKNYNALIFSGKAAGAFVGRLCGALPNAANRLPNAALRFARLVLFWLRVCVCARVVFVVVCASSLLPVGAQKWKLALQVYSAARAAQPGGVVCCLLVPV